MADGKNKPVPWYAGEHKDALFYLLIAIFFVELAVGGVSFFYGIIHAAPEAPGGPPVARFPWLVWAIASILAPVALLLLVHLAGTWVARSLTHDQEAAEAQTGDGELVPDKMKRFYASVRHAPTLVILLGIMGLGCALFFVDGAMGVLAEFGRALIPHLTWILAILGALLAIFFVTHAIMVHQNRKMEHEYAWRREVLHKTGLVLVDKKSMALPQDPGQAALLTQQTSLPPASPPVLEVTATTRESSRDDREDPSQADTDSRGEG